MGLLDSVKQRIRPAAPEEITAAPAGAGPDAAPGSQPPADLDALEARSTIDEKNGVLETNVEAGVATIEAAQAIWGKSGRWIVIVA